MTDPPLTFEGVITYHAANGEQAAHFFEHTLGLELAADDGGVRFYAPGGGLTIAVHVGSDSAEQPSLLFSTADLTAAAEHFLSKGCQVRELPWAAGSGFLARAPVGYTVAVIGESALASGGED